MKQNNLIMYSIQKNLNHNYSWYLVKFVPFYYLTY